MLSTLLEVLGFACLVAFAFLVVPWAVLLPIGVALVVAAQGVEPRKKPE